MLILLTDKCNLSCKHCMHTASPEGSRFMNYDLFSLCISRAKELGSRVINIAGGEPTLLTPEELDKFLSLPLEEGFTVILETNGFFLYNEKSIEYLSVLTGLMSKHNNFWIQVSSFSEYYANHQKVKSVLMDEHNDYVKGLVSKAKNRFIVSDDNNSGPIQLIALGRCSEGNMLERAKTFNRFPGCINSALIAKQCNLMDRACRVLEDNKRFCVPMIDPDCGMHMGESVFCKTICSIKDDIETIRNSMQNYRPCGKCSNYHWHFDNPQTFKEKQVAELLCL